MPLDFEEYMNQCTQSVCQDEVRATEQGILVQQKEQSLLLSSESFDALKEQLETENLLSTVQPLSRDLIQAAQRQDPVIGKMYDCKIRNKRPAARELEGESLEFKALVREWSKLEIRADSGPYQDYVERWRQRMAEAYDIASRNASKSADRGKRQYDKRVYGPPLQVGSRVLVRNVVERGGSGKIRSYGEDDIYVIKSQKGEDSPVFEVEPEGGRGRRRTLHRNMLLPCDFLPVTAHEDKTPTTTQTKKRNSHKNW
eukprot:superscaffoldBa00013463_g26024